MRNMLCSDMNRVRKDKLLISVMVAMAALAIIPTLCFRVIFQENELAGLGAQAKDVFLGMFNFAGDMSLVAVPMLAMILFKDFNQGTVRNKIIAGKSRTAIFFSYYLTALVYVVGIGLLYALLGFGASCLVYPVGITKESIGYFLGSAGLELNLYLFAAAMITLACVSSKTNGAVLFKLFGAYLFATLIAEGAGMMISYLETLEGKEELYKAVKLVNKTNVYNYGCVIGTGSAYQAKDLAFLIGTPLALSAILLFFGWKVMRKRDLK